MEPLSESVRGSHTITVYGGFDRGSSYAHTRLIVVVDGETVYDYKGPRNETAYSDVLDSYTFTVE